MFTDGKKEVNGLYLLLQLLCKILQEASQVVLVVKNTPASEGDIRDVSLIPGWQDRTRLVQMVCATALQTPV